MQLKNKTEEKIWQTLMKARYYKTVDNIAETHIKKSVSEKNKESWKTLSEARKNELKNMAEFQFYNTLTIELNDTASEGAVSAVKQIIAGQIPDNIYSGGSRHDYIQSLINEWKTISQDNIVTREDIAALTEGRNEKYNTLVEYADQYNTGCEQAITEFANMFKLNEADITNSLFMFFGKSSKQHNIQYYFAE